MSPLQDFIASVVVPLHHDSRQHCQRQIYNEQLQRLRSLDVHTCNLSWGRRILPNSEPADRGSFQTISEATLASHPLHLNHYAIQSLELFRAVKVTRGDVNHADYASIRDLDYFRRLDTNAINDDDLAIKSSKAQLL